ncbi:hypothetical protein ACHAWX_000359 [Stephanocyclus meneghinianus]
MSISNDHCEGFIGTGKSVDTLSLETNSYFKVIAPEKLPEGATFEANVNGRMFTVKIPVGGVEEGKKFSVSPDLD